MIKTKWFVQGLPNESFDTKLQAEARARVMFPHEDIGRRYARLYFRYVDPDVTPIEQWTTDKLVPADALLHVGEPIPHADLIRAVLDGKVVQFKNTADWNDVPQGLPGVVFIAHHVQATPNFEWRLKPEPVVRWTTVHRNGEGDVVYACWGHWSDRTAAVKHIQRSTAEGMACKLVRIELDPDTLDIISCRTEAP
jgi:hypothetical protein